MEAFWVYTAALIVLFVIAFLTKRHFGLLGLALATGYVLSLSLMTYQDLLIRYLSATIPSFNPAYVSVILILAPPIALLFHGQTYKTPLTRVVGALLFAVLAFVFVIDPLSRIVPFQGLGMELYARVVDGKSFIIGVGLVVALIDVFLTRPGHSSEKDKKK